MKLKLPETVLRRTPLGDQLNLYPKGLFEASGAGNPPQNETKDLTSWPWLLSSSKSSIANIWSIPGSTPTSLTTVIPAAFAYKFLILRNSLRLEDKKNRIFGPHFSLTPTLARLDIAYVGGWSLWRPLSLGLPYSDLVSEFTTKKFLGSLELFDVIFQ